MNKTPEEIIEEMQAVAKQMVLDDLEENPDLEFEYFDCSCCGKSKHMQARLSTVNTDFAMIVSCLRKQVLLSENLKMFRL